VAISRADVLCAKVLILDEPTAALGVKEAGVVLRYIAQARSRGLGSSLSHTIPIMRIRLATTSRFSIVGAAMARSPNPNQSRGTHRMMAGGEALRS